MAKGKIVRKGTVVRKGRVAEKGTVVRKVTTGRKPTKREPGPGDEHRAAAAWAAELTECHATLWYLAALEASGGDADEALAAMAADLPTFIPAAVLDDIKYRVQNEGGISPDETRAWLRHVQQQGPTDEKYRRR